MENSINYDVYKIICTKCDLKFDDGANHTIEKISIACESEKLEFDEDVKLQDILEQLCDDPVKFLKRQISRNECCYQVNWHEVY